MACPNAARPGGPLARRGPRRGGLAVRLVSPSRPTARPGGALARLGVQVAPWPVSASRWPHSPSRRRAGPSRRLGWLHSPSRPTARPVARLGGSLAPRRPSRLALGTGAALPPPVALARWPRLIRVSKGGGATARPLARSWPSLWGSDGPYTSVSSFIRPSRLAVARPGGPSRRLVSPSPWPSPWGSTARPGGPAGPRRGDHRARVP